jgi:hypothetical protein
MIYLKYVTSNTKLVLFFQQKSEAQGAVTFAQQNQIGVLFVRNKAMHIINMK